MRHNHFQTAACAGERRSDVKVAYRYAKVPPSSTLLSLGNAHVESFFSIVVITDESESTTGIRACGFASAGR
jgi:hypothetical protein